MAHGSALATMVVACAMVLTQCTTGASRAVALAEPGQGDAGVADAAAEAAGGDDGGNEAGGDDAGDGAPACPSSRAPDAGMVAYAADDSHLQYSGRVDTTDPTHPKFAASAVSVTANFQGSAVSVSFQDEMRYGSVNFFEVTVDDFPPVKVAPKYGPTTVDATPAGLCYGTHKATFVKRTEADIGSTTFLGFAFDGPVLPPDAPPAHKIEIIGDSITCGAGVEATSATAPECSQNGLITAMAGGIMTPQPGYGQAVENGYLAYGTVLARELAAEGHVTCTSGIGLVRNYFNRDSRTMPVLYDLMYPENTATTPLWDTTQYQPDVIVIGLGTNDFSLDSGDPANPRGALDMNAFEQAYVQFIDRLVAYYPGVTVVLVSSPILGDPQLTSLRTAVADVATYYAPGGAASMAEGGPPDVHVFPAIVDKVVGTGCGGHPSIAQQAAAAAQIAPVIKTAMGW